MDPSEFQTTLLNGFMDRLAKQCPEPSPETRLVMAIIKKAIQDVLFREQDWERAVKITGKFSAGEIQNQVNERLRWKKDAGDFLLGANDRLKLWTDGAGLDLQWVRDKIWKLLVVLRKEYRKQNACRVPKVA